VPPTTPAPHGTTLRVALGVALFLLAGVPCACGGAVDFVGGNTATSKDAGARSPDGSIGSGDGGSELPSLLGTLDAASDTSTASGGCAPGSQLVYVLSNNAIYSFDPPTQTFTMVASLNCLTGGMTPNSMAVDRLGNAWINFVAVDVIDAQTGAQAVVGGAIFKMNLTTGACVATNIQLSPGWYQLGMGYSTASATDETDTLYVTGNNDDAASCSDDGGSTSNGLGILDTTAGTLTPVGSFTGSLAGKNAELTGTGDGRLFGFFDLDVVKIAQIDKNTGATSNPVSMTGVECPYAFAFSFWGGDFYLYTASIILPDGGNGFGKLRNSGVTHYTTADGGIDTSYVPDTGFTIVGAGVSTCAPTAPPPR
jgi:hypothetical protein